MYNRTSHQANRQTHATTIRVQLRIKKKEKSLLSRPPVPPVPPSLNIRRRPAGDGRIRLNREETGGVRVIHPASRGVRHPLRGGLGGDLETLASGLAALVAIEGSVAAASAPGEVEEVCEIGKGLLPPRREVVEGSGHEDAGNHLAQEEVGAEAVRIARMELGDEADVDTLVKEADGAGGGDEDDLAHDLGPAAGLQAVKDEEEADPEEEEGKGDNEGTAPDDVGEGAADQPALEDVAEDEGEEEDAAGEVEDVPQGTEDVDSPGEISLSHRREIHHGPERKQYQK